MCLYFIFSVNKMITNTLMFKTASFLVNICVIFFQCCTTVGDTFPLTLKNSYPKERTKNNAFRSPVEFSMSIHKEGY